MGSAWDGLENSIERTELPAYALNKDTPEDAFFTKPEIARHCLGAFEAVCENENLDPDEFSFLEPSAGEGSFYFLLPENRRTGLDIIPRSDGIRQADFLNYYPETPAKTAVIGNPPFGHRGALAFAFVKRAFLFADLVAFILPMSFYSNGKGSNMKRVEEFAHLIHNEPLPADSFYCPETGVDVKVKTVFQIWKKGRGKPAFPEYDVSDFVDVYTCCSDPRRYCGLGRGRDYDCFIAGSFYRSVDLVYKFEDVLYNSGYGIVIKQKKNEIIEVLKNADWLSYCSDSTAFCKHIRKYHIEKVLGDHGFGYETYTD